MKTHTIKTDNAELLILELPETGSTFDVLMAINSEAEGYTLLGRPDEIREEDARELVKAFEFGTEKYPHLRFFIHKTNYSDLFTAKESLLSLIESEIYWVNPFGINGGHLDSYKYLWKEAEQKTFDRSRTLIFKKNK